MPELGDIIRLTVKGVYLQQEVINVFFYRVDSQVDNTWTLFEMLVVYSSEYLAGVLQSLSSQYMVNEFEAENLTNEVDFATFGVAINGNRGGEPMPSFCCVAVRQNRTSKVTRSGAKRFVGILEADVLGNANDMSILFKGNLETFCSDTLFLPAVGIPPQIVGLMNVIVGRTLDVNNVYQIDLSRINDVFSASVNDNVTTQNSRKP